MSNRILISTPYSNEKYEVPIGISLEELFEELKPTLMSQKGGALKTPPMNAKVNNRTHSLDFRLCKDCFVEYVDYTQKSGQRTYIRTMSAIISKAVADLAIPERGEIIFEHSIGYGTYARWGRHHTPPTQEEVARLEARTWEIIQKDLPIRSVYLPSEEVKAHFRGIGRETTAQLIEDGGRYFPRCSMIENHLEYIHGTLLPRTGMVWGFSLKPFREGMILHYPDGNGEGIRERKAERESLFDAFDQHLRLLRSLGMEDLGPMNRLVRRGEAASLISISEAMQEKQIAAIANEITRRHHEEGVRVVLISGPSSSGKTTFSKRLQTQLLTNLLRPYTLSLDDFFVNREQTPLDEKGEYDYESFYALDLPYLKETLNRIIQEEEIELPYFDFPTGQRIFRGEKLQLKQGELLIIEGIHALNHDLIASLPPRSTYKVYASALTTLSLDEHNWISTSDNRLIRRIVRDAKYRNSDPSATIKRWKEVRRGEEKWIFPYQHEADTVFNSAMLYELSALKVQAEPLLRNIKEIDEAYSEAQRLLHFLKLFEPITLDHLPPTSLLREFLGGSSYHV